jgi:uncharacterized Fe-S cluster-containing radical SAM superfamily protein
MISAKVKNSTVENLKKSTGLDGKVFNVTINVIALLIAEVLSNNYHYLEAKQLLTDWDIPEKIAKAFGDNYKSLKEYIDSEDQLATKNKMLNSAISFKKLIGVDWKH